MNVGVAEEHTGWWVSSNTRRCQLREACKTGHTGEASERWQDFREDKERDRVRMDL